MKKSKLIFPITVIGAMLTAITPLCLVSCGKNEQPKPTNRGTIPVDYLNIDENNILNGFKSDVDLEGYDTLLVPNTVTAIRQSAFYNSSDDSSTIPDSVVNLEFERTIDPEDAEHYILGSLSEIGTYAFYKSPFKKINLPWGLRKIDDFAFSNSKVEECYFPSFLNYIGNQAFSNTNLFSVMFNNEFKEYKIDSTVPPWMRIKESQIVEDSCVQYVGEKAFYNCENLIAHRVTPFMDAYQLDTNEPEGLQGPFAQYDETTSSTIKSNLRIFDFTKTPYDVSTPLVAGSGKGLNIFGTAETTTEPEENHFIIINTSLLMDPEQSFDLLVPDECAYLNRISNIFNGPTFTVDDFQQQYKDPPPMLNKWYIGSQQDWNYGLKYENYSRLWGMSSFSLSATDELRYIEYDMCSFYDNVESDLRTFDNDTKVNAELIDGEQDLDAPNLAWEVRIVVEDGVMVPKLNIIPLEMLGKWVGKKFHYNVSFSSKKFGCKYTYGQKYKYYHGADDQIGYWALAEDDNPIEICINN